LALVKSKKSVNITKRNRYAAIAFVDRHKPSFVIAEFEPDRHLAIVISYQEGRGGEDQPDSRKVGSGSGRLNQSGNQTDWQERDSRHTENPLKNTQREVADKNSPYGIAG
jgi:hypothetical protein